ncbi:MAG: histidinol-phosphatase [Planctomycetes bacterium]|nr:histidinol-phosphatase [Planctomycetota bacterium]
MSYEIVSRLELAKTIAVEAGQLTLDHFQHDSLEVIRKSDDSPVTIADREAEQLLRQRIAAAFPGDGILGEEFGEELGSSAYRWILDPIDGTKSFISGVPLFGTLVGVERENQSEIGVIYVPGLDEGIFAARGHGAWYFRSEVEPTAARVSKRRGLSDSVFLTSEVGSFEGRGADEAYRRLERAAYITRTWGDCYGYLLVAVGRAEVMVDPIMNVWDAAPLQPILEEAGGTFTDWQGKPTIYGAEGVATNGLVMEEVLAITRQFPKTS